MVVADPAHHRRYHHLTPLYNIKLRATDWRILWWLLCHQKKNREGVNTGAVAEGWRKKCLEELGVAPHTMLLAKNNLRAAGVIISGKYQRDLRINPKAFEYEVR